MVVCILPSYAKTLLGLFCNSNTFVHIRLSSSSNVNTITSTPAVRLFIGSALTISFGLACRPRGYTFDGVLLMYFYKNLQV